MLETLKIIHFFCLYGGGGAALGSAIVVANALRQGHPPGPAEAPVLQMLGRLGAFSIIVIWITGVAMTFLAYGGGAGLGWTFHAKMAGAALVLIAIVLMMAHSAARRRAGGLPDPGRMKMLSMLALAGTIVAVVFAVITFA